MGVPAHQLNNSLTNCPNVTTKPFAWAFVLCALFDPCGSVRTNAANGGQLRHFDAQRANAVPQSRELPHAGRIPLGKVQGRAQGFRHGRMVACKRSAP